MALPIAAFINVIIKLPNGINNAVAELPNVIAVTMLDIGMLIIFSVVISILTFAYWQIKSP